MKLYRRPGSPLWYFDFTDPETGRRVRKSTKRRDKAEARRVAQQISREALDRQQFGFVRVATLGELLHQYAESIAGRPYHKTTVSMIDTLDRLTPDAMARCASKMTTPVVEAIRAALKGPVAYQDPNRVAPPRQRSVQMRNHYIKLLRAAWNFGKRVGIRVDPSCQFSLEPVRESFRALTDDEVSSLRWYLDQRIRDEHANHKRGAQLIDARDLVELLLGTGARYSEIASLPWAAVSADCAFLTVQRGKGGVDNTIALPEACVDVLRRRRALAMGDAGPWVFPGDRAGDHRGMATGAIRRAMDELGFNTPALVARYGRATVHSLRHTFATRLVRGGASLYDVQVLLGHRNPTTTMRYAKLAVSDAALRAKRALDALPAHNSDASTTGSVDDETRLRWISKVIQADTEAG